MCAICALLDKSFPTAKQLARAYVEVSQAGVPVGHPEVVEEKMEEKLQEQNLTKEQLDAYKTEYFQEYNRLGGGWEPKKQ